MIFSQKPVLENNDTAEYNEGFKTMGRQGNCLYLLCMIAHRPSFDGKFGEIFKHAECGV